MVIQALAFLVALAGAAPAATLASVTLFVSPSGNDHWSGSLAEPNPGHTDGPLASFEGARNALRARRKMGRAGSCTVLVRGGTYALARTLVFEPQDSGTEEYPVLYAAFPGERPVVSGGRLVTDWRPGEGKLWTARVPKGWYFTRLFVDGERKTRARQPNTDAWSQWWQVVAGGPPEPDAPEAMGSKQFVFPPGTLKAWENLEDIEINSLPSVRYANFIAPLAKVDEAQSLATLTSMAYYNFRPGDPFRVENALAALDEPGEWCVNTRTGTVYYWPEAGVDLRKAEVIAPALTQLVRLQGNEQREEWVHDIVLRGFTFRHCDRPRWPELPPTDEANLHILSSAVYFEGTERCAIEDCLFSEVSGFAARFNLTSRSDRFVGNEVVGAGCGGLQLGGYGPGTKDVNRGHVVTNNHIHHCSTDFWHAGAIDIRQSGENLIAHNLIDHMPYTAIMISGAHTSYFNQYRHQGEGVGRAKYNFRWAEIPDDNPLTPESVKPFLHARNNLIAHNVVHDVLWLLPADGGALYGFGQGLGNVFRANLVYRAHCLAIYLDNEFDHVRVEDNIVLDSASPFGGSGASPILRGNALYEAGKAPPEVRLLAQQMAETARQATGPTWLRPRGVSEGSPGRDPATRTFSASSRGLSRGILPGQGGWDFFGPGSLIAADAGLRSESFDPGVVAVAGGLDSWAAIGSGVILDPAQDLVLQIDACLPAPLTASSSFELYLNAGSIHANSAFGAAIVGGAEDGVADAVGVRRDGAGPRVLADRRVTPGHWYRLRLAVAANSHQGRLLLRDLTAGEAESRSLTFPGGANQADLTSGDGWSPPLADLDTLVLRLGGGAQAANIILGNPPAREP